MNEHLHSNMDRFERWMLADYARHIRNLHSNMDRFESKRTAVQF